MSTSAVIFLLGPSGSGKTVIARRVSASTGWALYDTDAAILARTGTARISDIFDAEGEAYFRNLERECLEEVAQAGESLIVATGGGLPAIPEAMDRMAAIGKTVYLKASLPTLWMRLSTDPRQLDDRPLLRNGGEEALQSLVAAREAFYSNASVTLDTDQLSVDEACALVATQVHSMAGS